MNEYIRMRRNRNSDEQKNKIRLSISRRDEVNHELVFISVDVSHEELGWHKGISFLLEPKTPTVDLTATSNYELFQMDTNDENTKISN